jgi:cell division FtsZ-interacting protein ZapD
MSGDSVLAVLARLEEGQKAIREELGTLASEQARLRTDVMARLDRQQNDLTGIREDIGVNMAAVLHAVARGQSTREDVRLMDQAQIDLGRQVSLLHRRLIALEERVGREGRP